MATAVELLHIATLIHDDTVDNSDFRRGRATISSMFGKDIAVLVGDYVFASSATFVCDTGHVGVIRRFSETIMELSSGELMERVNSRNASQTLDDYHNRIYSKTASLFSMAGETGATLSGAPGNVIATLKEYALELGMAFQIVDDILDFQGSEEEIGKPVGSDLAHGIMTLPAFIALERHPHDNPIKAYFNGHGEDEAQLQKAVDMCSQPEIIDTAYSEASRRCEVARKALHTLPKTPSRQALDDLLDYIVVRRS
jgi:heptaprenyl diphosphate synthase/octaprenyl-diphosphate synthase